MSHKNGHRYHNGNQARGYEVGLIHLLSPDEVEPPVNGDLKLVDVETG